MTRPSFALRLLLATVLVFASCPLFAQQVPVSVDVAGNVAAVRVGSASSPLVRLTLSFDGVTNLNPASLGVSARLVSPSDPTLLARLPSANMTLIDARLPLLITVEPPAAGNLAFERTVRVDVHTHALSYTAGSAVRLFKAPLGGDFHDITDEIAPGSVRARGTTGGFSQFLLLTDLRDTGTVVAGKFAGLRAIVQRLPAAEAAPLDGFLDAAEAAVSIADFAAADRALDQFRARVVDRAGIGIRQRWRAARDLDNQAGELLAGSASLKFSIAFLHDYGP